MVHRAALLLGLVTACASGDAGPGGEADARPTSDAAGPVVVDAAPGRPDADRSECLFQVPTDYGTPTPLDSTQFGSEGNYTYYADLVDGPFQRLFVSLHPETGVFPGAVQPGTYVLEGDETDYQWCGACVYLAVDDGDTPSTLYMAQSGKITIDTVGAEVHGSLSAVSLRHIEIAYTGKACGGGGEWPCGNTGCAGGSCGQQVEGPACETFVESFTF